MLNCVIVVSSMEVTPNMPIPYDRSVVPAANLPNDLPPLPPGLSLFEAFLDFDLSGIITLRGCFRAHRAHQSVVEACYQWYLVVRRHRYLIFAELQIEDENRATGLADVQIGLTFSEQLAAVRRGEVALR